MNDFVTTATQVRDAVKKLASFDLSKGYGLSSEKQMIRFPKPIRVVISPESIRTAVRYNLYYYSDDSYIKYVTYSKEKREIGVMTALRHGPIIRELADRKRNTERMMNQPA